MQFRFLLLLCAFLVAFSASAQTESLPTEAGAFLEALKTKINQTRVDDAQKAVQLFEMNWKGSAFSEQEKKQIMSQINSLLAKKAQYAPDISYYIQATNLVKSNAVYVKLQPKDFFDVNEKAIKDMEVRRVRLYFKSLIDYIPEGNPVKTTKFKWHIVQEMPRLYYLEIKDKNETYKAPVIAVRKSDISFMSANDSSLIKKTSGDFNLVSRAFVGIGGTIDWSKMGIPEAYCEFRKYRVNFNLLAISADSVTFHYAKMIANKPILGHFEEKNWGHKDANKADFPYFRSYGGGVTLKNILPGVDYQGGFSLKGSRTIGSAYDSLVTFEAPKAPTPPTPRTPKKKPEVVKNETTPTDDVPTDTGIPTSEALYNEFGIVEETSSEVHADDLDWYSSEIVKEEKKYNEIIANDAKDSTIVTSSYTPELPKEVFDPGLVRKIMPAKMVFTRNNKPAIQLQSTEFILDMNLLTGTNVQTLIFLGDKDTLSHPGMDLRYRRGDEELVLKRPRRGNNQPFMSTYHDFYMYFETVVWKLNSDDLHFTAFIDQENKSARVESIDFFSQTRYSQLRGVMNFHPLGLIYRFIYEHENELVTPEAVMKAYGNMNQDLSSFKMALPRLQSEGYLTYNAKSNLIEPSRKLYDWVRAALQKKDYDPIMLVGNVSEGSNALMDMNLNSLDVDMNGVKAFALSDSQFVRVVPRDEIVKIKKDRNLQYGGLMAVGKMNFFANERTGFTFGYEGFDIYLDNIDSLRYILVRNPPDGYEFTPLQRALRNTAFEKVKGRIHIDDPKNKNGAKDYRSFPVLDTYDKSYVYWAKDKVQEGVYEKEKLFFALDPFVLDSLATFDERSLRFDGSFFTSNIFQEFRQTLAVMPDNSLGLRHSTELYGMDCYNKKGKFFNELTMDMYGLHGKGKIEYLETTTTSDTFVFHFDSCFAYTKTFDMRRSYHIPEVKGERTDFRWYVNKDKLEITTIDKPLQVFGGEATFEGKMIITPKGVLGKGTMTSGSVSITSDSMVIDEMEFYTFDGTFALHDDDTLDLNHFIADHVDIKYDVRRHETSFQSKENGVAHASFPIHKYKASLNKGTYKRESGELAMEALSVYPLDNYFVSVNPAQDSLKFTAKQAFYTMKVRNIEVRGVPVIVVADALITPADGKVTIYPDGFVKKIENCTVEADLTSKQHKIYGANVDIYSAKQYRGTGIYDYITVNGKPQFVKFDSMHVDQKRLVSMATSNIKDEQNFYITEKVRFRGEAELDASRKYMAFKGEVKIESDNDIFKETWFSFPKTVVNPDSLFIPIEEDLSNASGEDLTVGLNHNKNYKSFYSTFLQPKQNGDDIVVLRPSAIAKDKLTGLTFDRTTKEFRIGSEEKLKGTVLKGTTVSFNEAQNTITSTGRFNVAFQDFYKKTIIPKIVGSWKEDLKTQKVSTNLVLSMDFPGLMPTAPSKKLIETFMFMSVSMKDVNYGVPLMKQNLCEFLDADNPGDEKTKAFYEASKDILVTKDIDIAKALPNNTLLLSNVNFNYNPLQRALYHSGDVGLLALNGETVNKMVKGKILWEFSHDNDEGVNEPDKMTVLLEIDKFNFIYLEFFRYEIKFYSNYTDDVNVPMEAELAKIKKNKSELKVVMGTQEDVTNFRKMYEERFAESKK